MDKPAIVEALIGPSGTIASCHAGGGNYIDLLNSGGVMYHRVRIYSTISSWARLGTPVTVSRGAGEYDSSVTKSPYTGIYKFCDWDGCYESSCGLVN